MGDVKLDGDTIGILGQSLGELGDKWTHLATYLGFSDRHVLRIVEGNAGQPEMQARVMLDSYNERYNGNNLIKELSMALKYLGMHDLLPDLGEECLDDQNLKVVARSLGDQWPKLALYLGVSLDQSEKINLAFDTVNERAGQMLAFWRKEFTGGHPVEHLARMLITIDRRDLADKLAPVQHLPKCFCGNTDPFNYRKYYEKQSRKEHHEEVRIIGIRCTSCGQEWLEDRFLFAPDEDGTRHAVKLGGITLKLQEPFEMTGNPIFQVNEDRTRIDISDTPDELRALIRVGDHIAWHRYWPYWHHGIVSETGDLGSKKITIIHWSKNSCDLTSINEVKVDLRKESGEMYRINYPEELTKVNPPVLVLARARARLNDVGYGLFKDNCEAFSTYCKVGIEESRQVWWFYKQCKDAIIQALTSMSIKVKDIYYILKEFFSLGVKVYLRDDTAGPVESLTECARDVQVGVLLSLEGLNCLIDLTTIFGERTREKSFDQKEFIKLVTERITASLCNVGVVVLQKVIGKMAGQALVGAAAAASIPPVAVAGGLIVATIAGGLLTPFVGKALGAFVGPYVGRAAAALVDGNDVKLNELKRGDQLVLYGNILHPRHHMIVVKTDLSRDIVTVIHNTYKNGVVEEQVPFTSPAYRIKYELCRCLRPDDVIKRARSKIGDMSYKYSLVINNCKDFARGCKLL